MAVRFGPSAHSTAIPLPASSLETSSSELLSLDTMTPATPPDPREPPHPGVIQPPSLAVAQDGPEHVEGAADVREFFLKAMS